MPATGTEAGSPWEGRARRGECPYPDFPGLASLAQAVDVDLCRGGAARLGEAAVMSGCVHLSGEDPAVVRVDAGADAGRVFYGRGRSGEVLHLDVFHQVGEVDHRGAAEAVRQAVDRHWADFPLHAGAPDAASADATLDHVDIQTATGGGRVSGSLAFGRKPSLRRAHLNHVHLAFLRDPWAPALPFYLVAALEEEVLRQGLEPRRIDRVEVSRGEPGASLDLSDYTAPSDSLLREPGSGGRNGAQRQPGRPRGPREPGEPGDLDGRDPLRGPGERGPGERGPGERGPGKSASGEGEPGEGRPGEGEPGEPLEGGRRAGGEAGGRGGMSGRGGPGGTGGPGAGGPGSEGDGGGLYAPELADALDLAGDASTFEDLRSLLEDMSRRGPRGHIRPGPDPDRPLDLEADHAGLLDALRERGYVKSDGRRVVLTPAGEKLLRYLGEYGEEVLRMLRRLCRRRPRVLLRACQGGPAPAPSKARRGRRSRTAHPFDLGWTDQLAVTESLARAAGEGRAGRGGVRLRREDLLFFGRHGAAPPEICLLVDSSASMAGRRIRAARQLAYHLVLATRSRVALLAFQERNTRVLCPFTRDRRRLETGLRRMQAFGLTPLAGALGDCLEFLRVSRCRSPLLLLVSDGVPTVPRWSLNPLVDALKAAAAVAQRRVSFVCVGLEPSRAFLEKLAKAAGGRLYVVEELERDALVAIARREGERA